MTVRSQGAGPGRRPQECERRPRRRDGGRVHDHERQGCAQTWVTRASRPNGWPAIAAGDLGDAFWLWRPQQRAGSRYSQGRGWRARRTAERPARRDRATAGRGPSHRQAAAGAERHLDRPVPRAGQDGRRSAGLRHHPPGIRSSSRHPGLTGSPPSTLARLASRSRSTCPAGRWLSWQRPGTQRSRR